MSEEPATDSNTRWAALRNPSFARFWAVRILVGFAVQIQTVAVGWQVYDITRNPLDLGLVGLSQFLPALLLVLVTGTVADRFRRRSVMAICLAVMAVTASALLAFTLSGSDKVWLIFVIIFCFGTARAFFNPAQQSLLPNIVPTQILGNAIALNAMGLQIATVCGPVAGGLLYDIAPPLPYISALALFIGSALIVLTISRQGQRMSRQPANWNTILAGFRYIWHEKIVLGAISLDLFAVLLGGATALLPIFARDILQVDASGLGMLRAAQAAGAISMSLYLATRSIRDHAGVTMLLCVGLFGAATIVFGVSTVLWLSIAALFAMGAVDMISVYVRQTLVQLWTPDDVRGRVNAVSTVFVGASNELGEFRAGVSAWAFGTVAAVVLGGMGAIGVAALWAYLFPELRRARRLDRQAKT